MPVQQPTKLRLTKLTFRTLSVKLDCFYVLMLVIETLLNSLPRQLVQLRCKLSAVILASIQSLLTIIVGSSLVRETILSDSLIQKFFVLTMSSIAVEPSLTQ